jgi:hypothetical protein
MLLLALSVVTLTSPEAAAVWVNRPASPEPTPGGAGVYFAGDARFQIPARGPHLVEITLAALEEWKDRFALEAAGAAVDTRFRDRPDERRLRPQSRLQRITLRGMVDAAQPLVVKTASARYILYSVSWTPQQEFETTLVPQWLDQARKLRFDWRRGTARRLELESLAGRLLLSAQAEVRREAIVDLTRALYWVAAENHEPAEIDYTGKLFLQGLQIAPQDPILRQMISASCLGLNSSSRRMPNGPYCNDIQPTPWEAPVPAPPPGAPPWAVEQRKLAARLDAITRWWVEKRQRPDGQLGGGWGDDVEILRQWGPQALGLGSQAAARGLKVLAGGLWKSGTLLHGYDRGISDVEHSSEPTTDTQPLLAALDPDSAEARARLAETAACSEYWIGPQPDDRWRFRSSWFNCRERDPRPERALDVHLNTRAMGPALWYAYLTRDAALVQRLVRWGEAWVEAMRSTKHGKPAGVFPPVVRSIDGSYLIGSQDWAKPNAEWDYFQWSGGAQEALASLLLALHDLTGDQRWLEAAGETFDVQDPALRQEILTAPAAYYEWQRRTGKVAVPDAQRLLARMAEMARETEARYSVNFDMLTSEVIYTDRVYYALPADYRQYLFGGESPRGDRYPTFAVTWPPAGAWFARAVLDAGSDRLTLRLYNFEDRPLEAAVRVWRLAPGRYRWEGGEVEVSQRAQLLSLPVPARREVTVALRRIGL